MDFGAVGLDHHHGHHHHHHHHHHQHQHHGLGVSRSSSSSEAGFASSNVISSSSSDPETKQRALLYGSELSSQTNKQERSAGSALEDYWRSSKVAKTVSEGVDDDFSSVCKGMMFHQRNNNNNNASLLRSNSHTSNDNNDSNNTTITTLSFLDNGSYNTHSQQHQMLSFCTTSPTKSETHNNATALPYFPNALSAYTTRNTGYPNSSNMYGGGMMMRSGPFTASQWMELEHQALIYKYITANVPIPSNLLIPIRKAFDSSFPPALLRANPLGGGWGTTFQLGFSNNADPEPGRCRRTDGKKWRCSRDAVADQKYCERHMNRGRHRSRKPVEGPVAALTPAAAAPPLNATHAPSNRKDSATPSGQQQSIQYDAASREFGLVTSVDSLLLSPTKPHEPLLSLHHNNSLHQFMDSWHDRTQAQAQTQLSISIPNIGSSETNLSPLRLSSRQAHWIPVSWEASSLGGPLGEALNKPNNSNTTKSTSSSSVLNLMPETAWDGSPPMGSSPTGVLQRTAFGSLSNSSAGSSPARAHPTAHEGVNMDLLPSAAHLGSSSSSLPAL